MQKKDRVNYWLNYLANKMPVLLHAKNHIKNAMYAKIVTVIYS